MNDTTFLSLSSVLRDTSFVLYATNSFGCKSDPVYPKITIGFEPLADFFMEPNPAYIGDEITFTNTSYRQDSIVMNFWKFGVEENQLMDIHPKHTYEQAGYYDVELVVVSAANCLSMIKKTIRIKPKLDIFIPSAFTPNTDYINDVFYARGEVIDDMHMRIYNQWGLLIFQTKNKFIGWDGTWKGKSQPEGNYTYVFECTTFDQQLIHLTGVFSLIR